jgi:hypothetical protein
VHGLRNCGLFVEQILPEDKTDSLGQILHNIDVIRLQVPTGRSETTASDRKQNKYEPSSIIFRTQTDVRSVTNLNLEVNFYSFFLSMLPRKLTLSITERRN